MRTYRFHVIGVLILLLSLSGLTQANNWNSIEPLVTDREEVLIKLGKPLQETAAGPVYNYDWGTVSIVFVTDQDIAARKFKEKFRGKVRGVVVDYRSSNLTPLALGLIQNPEYEKQAEGDKVHYVNSATGITYQFVKDKLTKIFYEGAASMQKKAGR